MKNVDCSWEKIFGQINRSIRHYNYPNSVLLSDTNIGTMGVPSSIS